jgi:hypothetical protein
MYKIFAETSYASKKRWFDPTKSEPSRKIRGRGVSSPSTARGLNISDDLSGSFQNASKADSG